MVRYCLQLVVTHDYFYCLQSHLHGPVNDPSTAVQLTNRLLRFWADGGFVYYKRVSSPSFLVSSQSLNHNNIVVCNTLGATDFSSAVSGFCQVFIVTRAKASGAEFFSRLRRSWLRPSANTENSRRTREKPLVPRIRLQSRWLR